MTPPPTVVLRILVETEGTVAREWRRVAHDDSQLKERAQDGIGFLQSWGCQASVEQVQMEARAARAAEAA